LTAIHIIVGDAHSKPEVDNRRFDWLGKVIVDTAKHNPDATIKVIDMGDWEDMPSLSSYDIGKKCYEGRRYKKDLSAAWDARERVGSAIARYKDQCRRSKQRQVPIQLYALGGNHFERRIDRAIESSPLLEGTISVQDGRTEEFGWEYTPFLKPKEIDGISYVHYWQGNGTSQPIGMGKYPAQVLIREKHSSTVTAHNHIWDVAITRNGRGDRIFALSAGCYLDPEQEEHYAGQNNKNWTRCLTILYDVKDGFPEGGFDLMTIEEIQRRYG
jgi:hypothetical protein